MHKVHILFGPPLDNAAFVEYFEETHRPILNSLPDVVAIEVNWVVGAMTGDLSVHLIVELIFATEAALQDGLNSAAGQKMARDYPSFASGGVTILFSNSETLPPSSSKS